MESEVYKRASKTLAPSSLVSFHWSVRLNHTNSRGAVAHGVRQWLFKAEQATKHEVWR